MAPNESAVLGVLQCSFRSLCLRRAAVATELRVHGALLFPCQHCVHVAPCASQRRVAAKGDGGLHLASLHLLFIACCMLSAACCAPHAYARSVLFVVACMLHDVHRTLHTVRCCLRRPDIFPQDVIAALGQLRDAVPAHSYQVGWVGG